jgi:hypothetical protein
LLLALIYTATQVPKPPVIDDTAYLAMAEQIAHAPGDPYGFTQFWYQYPMRANEVLMPPVVPYWLGAGIGIFGNNAPWLKLWMLPFAAAFAFSLRTLFDRFAGKHVSIMVAVTMFSPAFFPSLNLMLDVPAIALGLSGMAVMVAAVRNGSWRQAWVAGFLAGLSAQTKYNGLLFIPLLAVYATFFRRPRLGVLAAASAVILFGSWEWFVASRYGESHFVFHVRQKGSTLTDKLRLLVPLVTLSGGILAPAALIGIAAIARSSRWVAPAAAGLILLHLALAAIPSTSNLLLESKGAFVSVNGVMFGISGLVALTVIAGNLWTMLMRSGRGRPLRHTPDVWFLTFWLMLELVGYVAMTPFCATRRLMGLFVVSLLITGRLASRRRASANLWNGTHIAWAMGISLGITYTVADLAGANVEPAAVRAALDRIGRLDPNPRIWYAGHWGFQYEANRVGMKPVIPRGCILSRGDWLVVPDRSVNQQRIRIDSDWGELVEQIDIRHPFPLRTLPYYYGGYLPASHAHQPAVRVRIYRVVREAIPADAIGSDDEGA